MFRKMIPMIMAIVLNYLAFSIVRGQIHSLSKYIYRVKIRTDSRTYVQTGFRKEGTKGIITALHGAAMATSLSARNNVNDVLINLKIVSVDFANDLALISSQELDSRGNDGIKSLEKWNISSGEKLHALGYPLGIDYHDQPVEAGYPVMKKLKTFIPPHSMKVFIERKSPYIEIDVINIAGSLVGGHSGAPIVNENNLLVGIGNGGLLGGAADISWAIPINNIQWQNVTSEILGEIERLVRAFKTNELFELQGIKSIQGIEPKIAIEFGFGFKEGDQISLGNIPKDIRTTPPHEDDVINRYYEILDPDIPDNYLVRENAVLINLENNSSFDLSLNFWGIVKVAIRTSTIKESEIVYDKSLFRKNYIKPEFEGDAFIYYTVKSKERRLLDGDSFSLPITVTYPFFCFGRKKEIISQIVGGTNILLPQKIEFIGEQGWDRFGALEVMETNDLGELKEIEWFGGIGIEGAPTKSIRLGIQFTLIYTDYQKNFKVPLSLEFSNEMQPSFRLNITKLLSIN